ncbi:MAG: hypothetical protein JW786_02300 [Desulfobacterales bacterium]|nr:hypothetical protein [Desulfobacterales bacterium]
MEFLKNLKKSLTKKESTESEAAIPVKKEVSEIPSADDQYPAESIETRIEKEVLDAKRIAALKEHKYRAGVINFISVLREDLDGINANNYKSIVKMTIATLTNFINVAEEENAKLSQWLQENK